MLIATRTARATPPAQTLALLAERRAIAQHEGRIHLPTDWPR